MSLRTKFILALLLTSLASVGLVGGVAYLELMHKFNARMQEHSFDRFEGDVTAYVRTYGSWEEAERHEPFGEFTAHHTYEGARPRERLGPRPPPGGFPPSQPPGPMGKMRLHEAHFHPPFRFVLFNPAGKALLPTPPYQVGEAVRASDKKRATPILLNGRIIAYALPQGVTTLSKADRDYLHSMRTALAYGVISAAVLALLLGILFGNTLSRALRQLTHAIRSMGKGSLHQRVQIGSRDEVGLLAEALNQMSEDLTQSHEALEHSNRTIRQQAERLEELSIRDFLTELHNRRHFDEEATRIFKHTNRYRHPLSVMLGDLDFFKNINDQFSHAIGDSVLKEVANILRENTRDTDLVARYGGEEFVIAFPETPLPQAVALCEKLRTHIETHDWAGIHPDLEVTISIGISSNADAADMEAMLQTADKLLYQAKQNGRNQVRHA